MSWRSGVVGTEAHCSGEPSRTSPTVATARVPGTFQVFTRVHLTQLPIGVCRAAGDSGLTGAAHR